MADSKCLNTQQAHPRGLINCGICHAIIDKPKMLPCLHSFCLHCLSSWADSAAEKDPEKYTKRIQCPLCKEEYDLPTGGVKSLQTNFFVLKLKEMKTIQQKLDSNDAIPCTVCETSSDSVSHCVECHDFLCKKCVDAHKRVRVTRDHQLLSLEEFCADNLSRPMFNHPEQEKCLKHKGETLLFFCEKCEVPICRNCTVVDHPSDHEHVDLEEAIGRRSEELNKLVLACQNVSDTLALPIETDKTTLADLKSAVAKAEDEIIKASDRIKTACLLNLRTLEGRRENAIGGHLKMLLSLQTRLQTALEVTPVVTQIGSDHDKAAMFFALSSTMKQACEVEPKATKKSLARVGFKSNEELVKNLSRFGSLVIDWNLDKTFGQGQMNSARCAVFNMAGDIAATDNYNNIPLKVFGRDDGQIKLSIKTAGVGGGDYLGRSQPWGLAIGKDGQYFITDLNPYVKVFDAQGNFKRRHFKRRFRTHHPTNGYWSDQQGSQLYGLAIDGNGRVLVGSNHQYISIHDQDHADGQYTSSFATTSLVPYFIAVTSADNILVSDHASYMAVHVYDTTGKHLHTFQNPEGTTTWYPTGMCCVLKPFEDEEEVYVACKSPPAIYRYSVTGEYLGVFTKDVKEPWGISINMIKSAAYDDAELLVVDQNTIKVFKLE